MSVGRLIGIVVVVLVLFAIVSDPQDSAASVRDGVSNAGSAGTQITVFLSNVVNDLATTTGARSGRSGSGSGSEIGDPVYPDGGVETGDGSAPTS